MEHILFNFGNYVSKMNIHQSYWYIGIIPFLKWIITQVATSVLYSGIINLEFVCNVHYVSEFI